MSISLRVESFLTAFCPSSSPLLLALSGGADSLCLFYCLLAYRERIGTSFHIAHVDHGWRSESQTEAEVLQKLALHYHVPFHLKTLNPSSLSGNLEAACRQERYAFFAALCQQYALQGVLTGHHQDDQAETVFKRVLEGSHWSKWEGLKAENWIQDVRVLRPLLEVSKKDIRLFLAKHAQQPFEDPTNQDERYLRARFRETIFPWLNQTFGKEVQKNFLLIREEAQELTDFFNLRLQPLLETPLKGPWGICLDLQKTLPATLLEIKYLLRLLVMQQGFFLSRPLIEQIAQALQQGQAHQLFVMGSHRLWVDRRRLFVLHPFSTQEELPSIQVKAGYSRWGNWEINVTEEYVVQSPSISSWQEAWQGHMEGYFPLENYYTLGFLSNSEKSIHLTPIKKRWSQAKVPAFLYSFFPLLWQNSAICGEFLTGKSSLSLKEKKSFWKINLNYIYRKAKGSCAFDETYFSEKQQ